MFDPTLFEKREIALGVVVALVSSFSIVGLELVLSQRLQLVLGYSPLQAALFVLPGSLLAFIGGAPAGRAAAPGRLCEVVGGGAPFVRPGGGGAIPWLASRAAA